MSEEPQPLMADIERIRTFGNGLTAIGHDVAGIRTEDSVAATSASMTGSGTAAACAAAAGAASAALTGVASKLHAMREHAHGNAGTFGDTDDHSAARVAGIAERM